MSVTRLQFETTIDAAVEDLESDAVRAWAPAYENYTLSEVSGGTRLTIDQDVTADFAKYMEETWPRALEELKKLCEADAS